MQVKVTQLGLAAFIKMHGATLTKVDGRAFIFESDKSVQDWRVEYNNSCCMKHDALVCELRHHLQT